MSQEIVAPDGETLVFPDSMSEDEIRNVMRNTYGGSKPSAPAGGPNPMAARGTEQPQPSERQGVDWGGIGRNALEGFNRGLTDIPGGLVDLANNAPKIVNLLPGEQGAGTITGMLGAGEEPIGGSASLRNVTDSLGVTGQVEADTPAERFTRRMSREVGASLLPQAGLTARAGRFAQSGKRTADMNLFDKALTGPFQQSPVKTNVMETTAAAGAGAGAGLAQEQYPNSPLAEAVGGILGGASVATGLNAGENIVRAGKDVTTDRAARVATGQHLLDRSTQPDAVMGDATVQRARDMRAEVPGLQPTTGQSAADPGILGEEYNRSTGGPNRGAYATREAGNNAILNQRFDDLDPSAADDAATRGTLETRRSVASATADDLTNRRSQEVETAKDAVQPGMSRSEAGREIRTAAETGRERIEGLRDAEALPLLQQAEQSGAAVDVQPVVDVIDQKLTTARRPAVRKALEDAKSYLYPPGSEELDTTVTGLYEARKAVNDLLAGRTDNATAKFADSELLDVRNILDEQLSAAAPQFGQYLRKYREGAQRSDAFKQGSVGKALDRDPKTGQPKVPDSEVAAQFWRSGKGSIESIQEFEAALGGSQRAKRALRDYALNEAARAAEGPDGLAPNKLRKWIEDNREQLRAYPEIEEDLGTYAKAKATLDRTQKRGDRLKDDLNNPSKSTIARYLDRGTAKESMRAILSADGRGRTQQVENLVRTLKGNPEALEGARRGFFDLMEETARGTQRDVYDNPLLKPAEFRKFLNKHDDQIKVLYRDNPEHLENLRKLQAGIDTVQKTATARAPGSSGTAQGRATTGLTMPGVLSRLYAIDRGVVSPAFIASEMGARIINRVARKVQGERFNELLDAALLEPEIARTLALEANKENERQITKGLIPILERFGARSGRAVSASGDEDEEGTRIDINQFKREQGGPRASEGAVP